ncbi:MAG TPA: hypothetical protein VFU37_12640 [Pyrinomonadaceae bacterium]|nr:hypothetical protein [Pyrinomonadaceae bacterium]
MKNLEKSSADFELAVRVAKLWPNRDEASRPLGLLCRLGLHRWRRLKLSAIAPDRNILHCFWCSKVKVDGQVHDI